MEFNNEKKICLLHQHTEADWHFRPVDHTPSYSSVPTFKAHILITMEQQQNENEKKKKHIVV